MSKRSSKLDVVEELIRELRGQRVILDSDLARLYGVTTMRLNEQVKRNMRRFPSDFMFRLTPKEYNNLISQFAISSSGHGGRRNQPLVFTEQGAIMAANVLNSPAALRMSVFVVRAFVKMRTLLSGQKEFARQLAAMEKKLSGRLDLHEVAIVDIIQRMMVLLDPLPVPECRPKRRIGFHAD